MAKRLHKLHRLPEIDKVDASVSRELLGIVSEARQQASLDILKMSRVPSVFTSDAARRGAISKVLSRFYDMGDKIEEAARNGANKAATLAAGYADSDLGTSREFTEAHFARLWDNLSPDADSGVGANISDSFRRWTASRLQGAVRDVWREGDIGGWSMERRSREVRARWADFASELVDGDVNDRNGRKVNVKAAVDTLTRTINAKIVREIYFDRVARSGGDLVIIENADDDACKKCAEYDGIIISITGNDVRFPSYKEALSDGWGHHNCRCSAEAVDTVADAQAISDQAD